MSSLEPWLNLKLDLLPSIAQEVEQISGDYVRIVFAIQNEICAKRCARATSRPTRT